MAITKTIEIDVNSQEATNGINNITNSIDGADKATQSLKSQLREAQAEVAELSNKFGSTSKEAIEAAKRAAELKDKIGDAKALTDAFNPDAKFNALSGSLAGVAGGFSAVEGSLALAGIQSENLQETMVKLQAAMALSQGLQTIGESVESFKNLSAVIKSSTIFQKAATAAQWLWNAAMSANPIGAVITAIVALIAAGYKLISWYQDSSEANEKAAAATKANTLALQNQSKQAEKSSSKLSEYNKYQYDLAKASGASSEQLRKLALKHKDEEIALSQKNTMLARSTFLRERDTLASLKAADASDDVIAAQEKLTQETYKEFNKQRDGYYKLKEEKVALIRQQNVEIRQEQTNHNKEEIEKQKEVNEKAKELRDKEAEEHKKFLEDKLKKEKDYKNDYLKIAEEFAKIKEEEDAKLKQEQVDVLNNAIDGDNKKVESAFKSLDTIKSNEQLSITERIEANKDYTNTLLSDTTLTQDQIDFIKQKSAENEMALNKLKSQAIISDGMNTLTAIANLAGEGTAIAKGVAVAQATMSGYEAVINAYKTAQKSPITAFFPGYPVVQAGLAATFSALNIKKILAVQKPSANGGGSSSMSVSGGASAPAPQFNVVGNTGVNQLAATIGQQQPVQAYVVANQVTSQQALDRNIVNNASLG